MRGCAAVRPSETDCPIDSVGPLPCPDFPSMIAFDVIP
jgi:hypothetical protein